MLFIHKSGKQTPGIGYFWSGCAGKALRGIEIMGLSVIDADTRLSFHLDAIQTPPTSCLRDNDLTLVDWYAGANRVGGSLRRRPLTPPGILSYHGGFY